MRRSRVLYALALIIACFRQSPADESSVHFTRDISPILAARCFECHGPDRRSRKSELRLDRLSSSNPVLLKSADATPELLARITSADPEQRMPPPEHGPPLSSSEVETIRRWLIEGAITHEHWAFVPPIRPQLPSVLHSGWPRNPIDFFVLRKLAEQGLEPAPRAKRHILLRRATFDLQGLPPTLDELEQFMQDSSVDAWESLLDRLLSSPRFGERAAQPWLDAARYADTTGHAADKPRTMWPYRDWVIDALNQNVPFDQFSIEQLAGDMLPGATESQRVATGFNRNSIQALGNNPRKEEYRVKGVVDRIDTTSRTWSGLTVACAECHDHKFDPLTQRQYYELFAIFNQVPHYGERFDVHGPQLVILPKDVKREIAEWKRRLLDLRELHSSLPESIIESAEKAAILSKIGLLEARTVTAQVMDELPETRETFIHIRGNYERPGEQVQPKLPPILSPILSSPGIGTSIPNRLTFARSLFHRDNPLTARVAVNRIWKYHFGTGIVATPDDFGIRGDYPTHPELLDWLAVEFMENGWDVKYIHRLIVTSATYQQSSDASSETRSLLTDRSNRWLSRGARRRLEAEQLRDVALAASGAIVEQIGGPSVYPPQPSSTGQFRDGSAGKWETSGGSDVYRRSLYTFWQRMSPYPSMVLFDATSRERCTIERSITNTPLQSLATMNDPHFVDLARRFGQRIQHSKESTEDRIRVAFFLSLSREPSDFEFAACQEMLGPSPTDGTWLRFAQAILNLDEAMTRE